MKSIKPLLLSITLSLLFSSYSYGNSDWKVFSDNSLLISNTISFNNDSTAYNDLDSIASKTKVMDRDQYLLSSQYSKLQKVLKKYQTIERKNQWKKIDIDPAAFKSLKPDDTTAAIKQIRERLFIVGDLSNNSKSDIYDVELMDAVLKYKKRHGLAVNYELTQEHINQMNEPISNRINTIKLNMKRCLEIPENLTNATDYIMVNVPSYRLVYIKDRKNEFMSDVFVGAKWSETEIFDSMMDRVVFSPYWNIPQSIVDKEMKLKIDFDENFLKDNNMEWNNGRLRQKPGEKNALGLVKFMFPNKYDIYMHDTPAKSLFYLEKRTFSHGCINIKDAKGLAESILKNDPSWSTAQIESAMNAAVENSYELKNKIPVYIGYFTAWVSEDTGEINFFEDIYSKDAINDIVQNHNSVAMD